MGRIPAGQYLIAATDSFLIRSNAKRVRVIEYFNLLSHFWFALPLKVRHWLVLYLAHQPMHNLLDSPVASFVLAVASQFDTNALDWLHLI